MKKIKNIVFAVLVMTFIMACGPAEEPNPPGPIPTVQTLTGEGGGQTNTTVNCGSYQYTAYNCVKDATGDKWHTSGIVWTGLHVYQAECICLPQPLPAGGCTVMAVPRQDSSNDIQMPANPPIPGGRRHYCGTTANHVTKVWVR